MLSLSPLFSPRASSPAAAWSTCRHHKPKNRPSLMWTPDDGTTWCLKIHFWHSHPAESWQRFCGPRFQRRPQPLGQDNAQRSSEGTVRWCCTTATCWMCHGRSCWSGTGGWGCCPRGFHWKREENKGWRGSRGNALVEHSSPHSASGCGLTGPGKNQQQR